MQRQVKILPHMQATNQNFGSDPDECPICHKRLVPSELEARASANESIQIAFQCTSTECRTIFVARYKKDVRGSSFELDGVYPIKFVGTNFAHEVTSTSSEFVEIYHQAEAAEAAGYDRIAGMGYRKSLEFLIKDYLGLIYPDRKSEIANEFLGKCIDKMVEDPKIKACAKRAAWLGNDETHYIRKWASKDIDDLKVLVRLSTNWIESSILTAKYESEMKSS
jgi:hypothetical protein